jgi:hypothetical protein
MINKLDFNNMANATVVKSLYMYSSIHTTLYSCIQPLYSFPRIFKLTKRTKNGSVFFSSKKMASLYSAESVDL